MQRADPWQLVLTAWILSLIATLGSLHYSGIGSLGVHGLGLPPCELCWYQRILMYPLTGILAVAWLRRSALVVRLALGFSIPGTVVALYHSLIQHLPHLELGECIVGSCSSVYYRTLGLTIPNQSLVAFAGITATLASWHFVLRATGGDGGPVPAPTREADPDDDATA